MKRVLLVSPFPPYLGGVSVSVQRLHDVLVKSGYKVVKFDTQLPNKRYNLRLLKLVKFLFLPFFLLFNTRFDVIHFHVSNVMPKFYVSLWRFLFSRQTKFIITIHGQITHILNSRLGYYSLSRFDKIICVKRGDLLNMSAELRTRSVEIPAFIPPVISGNQKLPSCVKFHDKKSFKMLLNGFIIYNDRVRDLYGFEDSINLLDQLRKRGKNAELVLIVLGANNSRASAEYIRNLKYECRSKGLESFVCWIEGEIMELWPVLKVVNVLLRPTKSDGDALSIREALYLKIPVITSDVVPRPADAIVYDMSAEADLLNKTLDLIDHYDEYVSKIGNNETSFASQIIEQYDSELSQEKDQKEPDRFFHLQEIN